MPLKFNIVQRGNSGDKYAPKKYYASPKADGEVSFRSLNKEIAGGSTTVSDTDVLAVLNDLSKTLAKHLAEGKIIRFGDFGSFQASFTSKAPTRKMA